MPYYIAAAALILALGCGQTAFAADNGMGENGYGYYHKSNGAATGWGTENNGCGLSPEQCWLYWTGQCLEW